MIDGDKTCSCGQGCTSFGACLRNKGIRVGYARSSIGLDATRQKKWDAELALYRRARAEGIQPYSTKTKQIVKAMKISDKTGKAYDAGTGPSLEGIE